jgi:hypothetical protein
MKPFVLALGALSLLALTLLSGRTPVHATGEVADCSNDSDLVAKVGAGGSVTFNCGTATTVLSGAIVVTTDTTIDGGGAVTLSGGNASRLFFVNNGATLLQFLVELAINPPQLAGCTPIGETPP